jgi:hypothetical protein
VYLEGYLEDTPEDELERDRAMVVVPAAYDPAIYRR